MISDMHSHTRWSSDSSTPVDVHIEAAIARGMKHLCITEHQDYDAPTFPPDYFTFLIDDKGDDDAISRYIEDLQKAKKKYKEQIDVLIGIEMGLQPHLASRLDVLAEKYPFDFIIGSTHTFHGMDAEDKRHYENISIEEAIRQYFEEEYENLKCFKKYDIVGHMDFALRYGPGAAEAFTYEKYGDVLDEILKEVIHSGKGIECNTSKYKAKNMTNPNMAIIKRYAELGGEIITFGSDAHTPERIGEGFEQVGEMVKACGIKSYAIFRNHEPFFFDL